MISAWTFTIFAVLAHVASISGTMTRKNVAMLTDSEISILQSSLRMLQNDNTSKGFQQGVAYYHGEPSMCKDPKTNKPLACCIHGMPTFPQWHRLYLTHFEQALVNKGLDNIGVPYWDWTQPITELPKLVQSETINGPMEDNSNKNAWYSSDINIDDLNTKTVRVLDDRLFSTPGQNTTLFDMVLDALEKDNYCDFEVQFEVAHNHIHYLVGGQQLYSMSTLEYSAFDPIFFLHHSNLDRILAIWQKLQEKRGKSSSPSYCSQELFSKPLEPFDKASNPIKLTQTFARADQLFTYDQLGYNYDDLTLNGMNIDQLYMMLESRKARERAFAVFFLLGIGTSAEVKVKVCKGSENSESPRCENARSFFILGGKNEMPWQFQKSFSLDVSDAVMILNQRLDSQFHVVAEVVSVNGTSLGINVLPKAHAYHRP